MRHRPIDCDQCRDLVSAHVDGQVDQGEWSRAESHLERCVACQGYQARAHALRRTVLALAPTPPDVSASALSHIARIGRPVERRVPRVAMLSIGVAELGLALHALLLPAGHGGHEIHRHSAVMYFALAVGFLVAAWRPWRAAAGVVPIAAVLVGCLVVMTALDVADGAQRPVDVLVHLVCMAGVGAAWWLTHPVARVAGPRPS